MSKKSKKEVEAIARIITDSAEVKNDYLKLIFGNEEIILDAVDGSETLARTKDIFTWIDSDFVGWNTDNKGSATEKTLVQVYEMTKDATYVQMFSSFSSDLRKLCLTQHQIKNFVRKYLNWFLTDNYTIFFLFESNNEFFVASVGVYFDGLGVHVYRFGYSSVWNADYRLRLVVPQLA